MLNPHRQRHVFHRRYFSYKDLKFSLLSALDMLILTAYAAREPQTLSLQMFPFQQSLNSRRLALSVFRQSKLYPVVAS